MPSIGSLTGDRNVGDECAANAVDRKIGERVRARRLEIEVSQEQLAERIRVTFQVQKYERGVNRIAAGRLLDIADALETPITRFFEGVRVAGSKATNGASGDVISALAAPGAHDLVRTYAAMTPAMRRRVLDLVVALKDET